MSIWRPESVQVEPKTVMHSWLVAQVTSPKTGLLECHIVGYCYEGRVSSPVMQWDPITRIATTRSGRQYELPATNYGYDSDADYVFNRWLAGYGIKREDVIWIEEPLIDTTPI